MHLPKGWTALHPLADGGDPWAQRGRMAAKLLMMKANPMLRTETGATPLHTAAGTANIDVVKVLLSAPGVNVNSKKQESAGLACKIRRQALRGASEQICAERPFQRTCIRSQDEAGSRVAESRLTCSRRLSAVFGFQPATAGSGFPSHGCDHVLPLLLSGDW